MGSITFSRGNFSILHTLEVQNLFCIKWGWSPKNLPHLVRSQFVCDGFNLVWFYLKQIKSDLILSMTDLIWPEILPSTKIPVLLCNLLFQQEGQFLLLWFAFCIFRPQFNFLLNQIRPHLIRSLKTVKRIQPHLIRNWETANKILPHLVQSHFVSPG